MYKLLIRRVLFFFDPEKIHHVVFSLLVFIRKIPGCAGIITAYYDKADPRLERKLFGITFKNPVGLAAGFDKDARAIDALAAFGFGFIEIGTVTPKPQPGNDKPRLFRLPQDHALINRMGFNNEGVLACVARLRKRKTNVIIGGNIGKNKITPNEHAVDDYVFCFEALHQYVDYFVVNVSSPNTPGLRELQEKEPLRRLLSHIKQLSLQKPVPKPVLLKIAPDLAPEQLDDVIAILKETGIDGVIATNTTISRENLRTDANVISTLGAGGLSGKPLRERSSEVIRYLRNALGDHFPIIGVGGIMSADDAIQKLNAGADLIQLYTGFIYEGPGIVKSINKAILKKN